MSLTQIIRDKLRPMREHGSMLLYVHGNHKARYDGKPRTATSTLTQHLNSIPTSQVLYKIFMGFAAWQWPNYQAKED